jgi:hypothetical protein
MVVTLDKSNILRIMVILSSNPRLPTLRPQYNKLALSIIF